jgi:hypothetical protein
MNSIKATVKGGRLETEVPADWPDGTEVLVQPILAEENNGDREEDWLNTPEAIADWLKWYDSLEPLSLTPEEEADAEAWMKKVNEYSIAKMNKLGEEPF